MIKATGDTNLTAGILERSARRYSGRTAIIEGSKEYCYQDLSRLTNAVALALLDRGVVVGDRVLLVLPDSLLLAACFFAAAKIGAIAVPVSVLSSSVELAYYVDDCKPRCVILHADGEIPQSANNMDVVRCWDWVNVDSTAPVEMYSAQPNTPAALLYTSGTTARQKGVLHCHGAFLAACRNVAISCFGFTAEDRVLSTSKMSFSFGLGFGLMFPVYAGAASIPVPTRSTLEQYARYVQQWQPTILVSVPSFLAGLWNASERWLTLNLASVRFVASAGEPLPVSLFKGFREKFDVEIVDGIGSTELLTHFISNRPGSAEPDSLGKELRGCECRLLDEDGTEVEAGRIGSLWVKSDTQFLSYWNREELTRTAKQGGWTCTGDKLFRDGAGRLHYRGRTDDMVKIAGMWVSPCDIEAALNNHPAVRGALVTAKPDGEGQRRIVAYVTIQPGQTVSNTQFIRDLAELIPQYMLPAAIVQLEEFPLTINGKPDRKRLPQPWPKSPGHVRSAPG